LRNGTKTKRGAMQKLFIGIVIMMFSASVYAEKPQFIFAYEDREGFPAYLGNGQEVPKENPGIDIEVLRLVEQRVPITVIFKRMPWKRCLHELGTGNVSAVEASYKKEREKLGVFPRKPNGSVDPSRRLTTETYSLYVLKDSTLRWDPQSKRFINLKGQLGAQLGYSIVGDLRKLGHSFDESGSAFTNLKKLVLGRLDGIITQESQTGFYIKKHSKEFASVVKTEPPLKTKPYYFIISHQFANKYPKITHQIWDTVAELRKTKLPALYARYYSL